MKNLGQILTDELIYLRDLARMDKDFTLSDQIRDELDSRFVFVFDAVDGQLVYHRRSGTREGMKKEILTNIQAEKHFDAWLFTVKNSNDYKRLMKNDEDFI